MHGQFRDIWVYLSASPLLHLTLTVSVFVLARWLYRRLGRRAWLNPVLLSVLALVAILVLTDTPYAVYFEGSQFVHFLLGPATVALAIPLYQQISKLRRLWLPITVALVAGVAIGGLSSAGLAALFGASPVMQMSLAPKSVTAPVAMGISEQIGGLPSLTAVLVVLTGVLGAVLGTRLLDLLKIRDDSIRGIAMGITAHGIGTARAFQVSREMGAFSGLAMALSAFLTAVILPWLLELTGFLK